jgi:regulator of protease activity HflC (stomatin/prohibitin superfamily)
LNKIKIVAVLATALAFVGCTRVSTGEIGLRKNFSGHIEDTELTEGLHQTIIGDVILFANKEILLVEENMTPQSKDKSNLADFDISFTYTVAQDAIAELYTKYSTTANLKAADEDEIFPMGAFVTGIVRASSYYAVSQYDALEVNNNRRNIEELIQKASNEKLAGEGLGAKVIVKTVNVRNIQPAKEIVESANRVSTVQNDLIAKRTEVEIAAQEAKRIELLSRQSGSQYVELLQAQAQMKVADALHVAAAKGSTIWVVPQNFTALGNTAGK